MRRSVLGLGVFCVVLVLIGGEEASITWLHQPTGVRLLENRAFDDSDEARREILELYKDLRVTDVCDGMDLVGLQDIGLIPKRLPRVGEARVDQTATENPHPIRSPLDQGPSLHDGSALSIPPDRRPRAGDLAA